MCIKFSSPLEGRGYIKVYSTGHFQHRLNGIGCVLDFCVYNLSRPIVKTLLGLFLAYLSWQHLLANTLAEYPNYTHKYNIIHNSYQGKGYCLENLSKISREKLKNQPKNIVGTVFREIQKVLPLCLNIPIRHAGVCLEILNTNHSHSHLQARTVII